MSMPMSMPILMQNGSVEDVARVHDTTDDVLSAEERILVCALKRADEDVFLAAARYERALASASGAQFVAHRLAHLTYTPYVCAVDDATARAAKQQHQKQHQHQHHEQCRHAHTH